MLRDSDVLGGGGEAESDEGCRQTLRVHLHACTSHVLVLPLGRRRRLHIANTHTGSHVPDKIN